MLTSMSLPASVRTAAHRSTCAECSRRAEEAARPKCVTADGRPPRRIETQVRATLASALLLNSNDHKRPRRFHSFALLISSYRRADLIPSLPASRAANARRRLGAKVDVDQGRRSRHEQQLGLPCASAVRRPPYAVGHPTARAPCPCQPICWTAAGLCAASARCSTASEAPPRRTTSCSSRASTKCRGECAPRVRHREPQHQSPACACISPAPRCARWHASPRVASPRVAPLSVPRPRAAARALPTGSRGAARRRRRAHCGSRGGSARARKEKRRLSRRTARVAHPCVK
jgi:hypothetical protein